jgi:hypothetical protein
MEATSRVTDIAAGSKASGSVSMNEAHTQAEMVKRAEIMREGKLDEELKKC